MSGVRYHEVWIFALGVVEADHFRRKLETPEVVAQEGGFLTACERVAASRELELLVRGCVVPYAIARQKMKHERTIFRMSDVHDSDRFRSLHVRLMPARIVARKFWVCAACCVAVLVRILRSGELSPLDGRGLVVWLPPLSVMCNEARNMG